MRQYSPILCVEKKWWLRFRYFFHHFLCIPLSQYFLTFILYASRMSLVHVFPMHFHTPGTALITGNWHSSILFNKKKTSILLFRVILLTLTQRFAIILSVNYFRYSMNESYLFSNHWDLAIIKAVQRQFDFLYMSVDLSLGCECGYGCECWCECQWVDKAVYVVGEKS